MSRLAVLGLATPIACGDDSAATPEESSSGSDTGSSSGSSDGPIGETSTPSTTADTSSSGGETTQADSSTSDGGGSSSASSGSESSGAPESSSSESSASSESGPVTLMCPAGALGPELPDTLFGNTFAQENDFTGSCGGGDSPDVGFTFTAPAAGSYTFDTRGSQLDTVVYVLDGTCDGTEIACNDDGDGLQSVVVVDLLADQTVTVIVDGNADGGAPFSLRVQSGAIACPDGDLGSAVPNLIAGDSSQAFNADAGSCGGGGGNDVSYLFTAPNSGTFTFDTFGSSFVSRIYVNNGTCGGAEIACGREGVLADLDAGQEVTVVIDSPYGGGEFSLNVDTLGGACPDDDLGNTVPQAVSDTTVGGDNTLAGTCGGDFSADQIYEFSAPQDGLYQFDTFGSALDTVLYLREASCDGDELDCNDDFSPNDEDSRIISGMTAGQTVLVAVDGNGVGAYDLNIDLVPCPDETIVGALPQSLSDSTEGGINKLQPSCGDSPDSETSDYSYSFTAPADGIYTFNTIDTSFDSVLYVLDGAACNGDEIACNDDFQFNWGSAVSAELDAGQTVAVVVDGDFEQEGDFTLDVGVLAGVCPDGDLGNTIPASVDGDTEDADNATAGSCGGLFGNDASYTFTAPSAGLFVFRVTDADFTPIIHVHDGTCGGAEFGCANPSFFGGGSVVVADLAEGQVVVASVDSDDQVGSFTLEVDSVEDGGDCCVPHDETGCEVDEVEDCVCVDLGDDFCCTFTWDQACVNEAIDFCGAGCV
jgi:hypothetical protein